MAFRFPGLPRKAQRDPQGEQTTAQTHNDTGRLLAMPRPTVGQKEVDKALELLKKYKDGKLNLEQRVIQDEQWYRMRHWEVIRKKQAQDGTPRPEPSSAWLFTTLVSKHGDAMDNYPQPNVLPREEGDVADAKALSQILPVVQERCNMEETYSGNWWDKLKHGTGVYGVFWDPTLENGLGDISIRAIDILNVFWEPGVVDIQDSKAFFITELWDNDKIKATYPHYDGEAGSKSVTVAEYVHDDTVDTSDKTLLVDCYYKSQSEDGRTLLHLMRIAGDQLLWASENEMPGGIYDHGRYPVEFDVLYPEKGSPVGFGYVSICKDPQMYIDKMSQNILENSMMATKIRYFAANSTGVNEEEFLDWSKPIVHVEGSNLDDTRLRQVEVRPLDPIYYNVMQGKIEELKETASNRDVNNGSSGSGVTAAAAISALQEAGNKVSRDMIAAAYRTYVKVNYLCIELIRQFYDERRTFRILGDKVGEYKFMPYSNAGLKLQPIPPAYEGQELEPGYVPSFRRPIFDIRVHAEKRNPFSQLTMNETAKELYRLGAFDPNRAQEALIMLDMMEFEGIEEIREKVQQGMTLMQVCQQMSQQMDQMAALIQALTNKDMGLGLPQGESGGKAEGDVPAKGGQSVAQRASESQQQAVTPYQQKLAQRSKPAVGAVQGNTNPVG